MVYNFIFDQEIFFIFRSFNFFCNLNLVSFEVILFTSHCFLLLSEGIPIPAAPAKVFKISIFSAGKFFFNIS